MADKGLATARERRRLAAEASPRLAQVARDCLAQGRLAEALECLDTTPDAGMLEEIAAQAVEMGDLLLWRRATGLTGRPVQTQELQRLAEAAQSQGKLAFAAQARALFKT